MGVIVVCPYCTPGPYMYAGAIVTQTCGACMEKIMKGPKCCPVPESPFFPSKKKEQ